MKTILILLLVGVLSIEAQEKKQDTSSFSSLIENMKSSLDTDKIDMLKNSSSETYTCQQVKEILELIGLGNYRVDAFRILSTQIEDPENKGIILSAFKNDLGNYKSDAFKISNSIKVAKKKEKKEEITEKKGFDESLTGKINITKTYDNCNLQKGVYGLADLVTPTIKFNKKVDTTSYSLWISYCTSIDHTTCRTPFSKKVADILPDWDGIKYGSPVSVYNLLTNNGADKLPKYSNYNITVIINNKLVAEEMIEVDNTCK
ncbi:MAG TPA: DUF4476 domain-containing protein [Leptospiraceae bacterium]|nr:DUF4476 domain-containing protein [Leptospiraceae bacterium]HNE11717.1 DUF4476 domain-containing protein [Leptospiraceae bacterium]HNN82438.1 DUF4476 domain-containing protein [Leptospiraceae bacterium]